MQLMQLYTSHALDQREVIILWENLADSDRIELHNFGASRTGSLDTNPILRFDYQKRFCPDSLGFHVDHIS